MVVEDPGDLVEQRQRAGLDGRLGGVEVDLLDDVDLLGDRVDGRLGRRAALAARRRRPRLGALVDVVEDAVLVGVHRRAALGLLDAGDVRALVEAIDDAVAVGVLVGAALVVGHAGHQRAGVSGVRHAVLVVVERRALLGGVDRAGGAGIDLDGRRGEAAIGAAAAALGARGVGDAEHAAPHRRAGLLEEAGAAEGEGLEVRRRTGSARRPAPRPTARASGWRGCRAARPRSGAACRWWRR